MNYEEEIKRLEAQIEEAEAQIQVLKTVVEVKEGPPPVWVPKIGEVYYYPRSYGMEQYNWVDNNVDKYYLKVGHLFKTEQEAEDHVRALILIEKIRRERYKAQGHWRPNEQASYTIYWDRFRNRADMHTTNWGFPADVFGLWQDFGALEDVIKKHKPELRWYFTEYLPSIN